MRKGVTIVFAAALLACTPGAHARPFTARDLATMDRVSDPAIAPDGEWIAYNLRSTDWDGNRGLNALRLVRRDGSGEATLTSGERAATSPRWAGDGRLFFLSSRSGTSQVWRRDAGGAVAQVTAFPVDVAAFRLAPNGKRLVAVVDAVPECADLACTRAAIDARDKAKSTGRLVSGPDRARYWDTYADGLRLGLFSVSLDVAGAVADARPLLRGWHADVLDKAVPELGWIALSADGRTVWFTAPDPAGADDDGAPLRLWSVPADGSGAPARLIPGSDTSDSRPALSPDGRWLAYVAQASNRGYNRTVPMLLDLRSGRTRAIAPAADLALRRISWSPDGRTLLATADADGQVPLMSIDVARGTVAILVSEGQVGDFDLRGRATAFVRDSLGAPGELFVTEPSGPPRALTSIGTRALADTPLSPFERFSFAGWNGERVSGYVVKPSGYEAGRKYPVAFLIHGGPHGSFGNAWSYRWNPQVWAGMGYGVVMIDFHGSAGYGEAFGRSVTRHWGDRPLEDLQKGWAHVLDRFDWLDGSRACALGGSYGGYMVNWIAGNWSEPWRCLVNHAGVFDNRVMAYSTDIPRFSETEFAGLSPDAAKLFDPSDHIAKWNKPMLVIHGARDYRVPLDQGIATHTALRLRKVPTELLVFPDENHWILKPQNLVQWFATVEGWLNRWTAGPKSPPPAKE